jgi:hypothetical protein
VRNNGPELIKPLENTDGSAESPFPPGNSAGMKRPPGEVF